METAVEERVGLFLANYRIGKEMPGAPIFQVSFSVYTPAEKVSGIGHITQATNPPLNIGTRLTGQYTYMCVMPRECHILVTAEGYPMIKWPQGAGIGPVIMPNVELRMVLTEDWKTGTANYKYQDDKGAWHELKDQPVEMIEIESM